MKLFTTEEIKSSKATELARDIRRTQDIKETLDKERTSLNNIKAEFDKTLANQRVQWITEEETALLKIKALNEEVEKLNRARELSLIPIDIERKRVDNVLMEANEALSLATNKQKYADEMVENLQDRLDEVSENEQALKQREEHLFAREKGCEAQEKATKANAEALTVQVQSWIADVTKKDAELQERKTAIELQEITLNERVLDLEAREQQITKDKSLIYSQRMALKAALDLTQKQHGN